MSTTADTVAAPFSVGTLLQQVRSEWRRRTLLHGAMRALAVALGLALLLAAIDQLASLPAGARSVLRWLPGLLLVAWLGTLFRRLVPGPEARRLALLAEERRPDLDHQLSTLLDAPRTGPIAAAFAARFGARLAGVRADWVPLDGGHALRPPAAAAIAAALLVALVPGGVSELAARWVRLAEDPSTGIRAAGATPIGVTAIEASRRFRDVRLVIEPPAYTGLDDARLPISEAAQALAGSTLRVSGIAPAGTAVTARILGHGPLAVRSTDERWQMAHRLAASDRGLEIVAADGDVVVARMVVPLLVSPDRAPLVTLLEPDDDLVLASAQGSVPIIATAGDDFGIDDFRLTWILSRGSGESFSFTDGGAEWSDVGTREGALLGRFELDVAALGLGPGDVLHVRAVATDRNQVTGPGEGVSRTRVIRIARDGEENEANTLIGFPIEPEKDPILSQRMIILLTERLIERAPGMSRDEIMHESNDIAREQTRLRERLADIIYARTAGTEEQGHEHEAPAPAPAAGRPPAPSDTAAFREWSQRMEATLEAASLATGQGTLEELSHSHDPDPSLTVNLPLVPAFNAMYEAERELRQADPRTALPHEYRALEIIQRVREAERVFLRGRQTVAPVDVAGVRGTGRIDDAAPTARTAADDASGTALHVQAIAQVAARLQSLSSDDAALALSALAARLLEDPSVPVAAGNLLASAAAAARDGEIQAAAESAAAARRLLAPGGGVGAPQAAQPRSAAAASYLTARSRRDQTPSGRRALEAPFIFATARYASGDWDSGQLVPANLIHSLALYTDIPVVPEGIVVELDSPELFRYPFLFLTGHLPVRFTNAEAQNIREYVERGGLLFIDDHNHDIDGAFHRTIIAELERIFGDDALERLPNDHELYSAFFRFDDGPPTTSHELNGWGDGIVHEHLFTVRRPDGRIGVLYSNKDYTSEWSYHVQNKRFLSLDNTRFGVNLLVYALTR
jgi:hypothetical protein